jgi:hypothetical protein
LESKLLAEPVMVGRERELEELRLDLQAAIKEKEEPFLFLRKQE